VGFIVHPTTLENLVEYYFPSFDEYSWSEKAMRRWWNTISRFLEPVHVKSTYVESNDFVLENNMVFVPYLPEYINTVKKPYLIQEMQDKVQDAVTVAKELGDDNIPVSIVGLGAYTSIVTQNGLTLNDYEIPVTTGNAYTTALAIQGVMHAAERKNLRLDRARVAVIGASGNIGSVLAQILSLNVGTLCLIGRESEASAYRLKYTKEQCYLEILKTIYQERRSGLDHGNTNLTGVGKKVYDALTRSTEDGGDPTMYEIFCEVDNLNAGTSLAASLGKRFAGALGSDELIDVRQEVTSLEEFDVVIIATNSDDPNLVTPDMLGIGTIVCCASVPSNISPEFDERLGDFLAFDGGLARLPSNSRVDFVGMPGAGQAYGCMAETFLLGFEGQNHSYCKGNLTTENVYRTIEMAHSHNFDLGELQLHNKNLFLQSTARDVA
jgi:predicted amino acid dehydrogenase